MRLLRVLLLLAPLAALGLGVWAPRRAETLPLFARKYSFQCTQCHIAFPKLNAFGMAFKQNGYRLAGTKGAAQPVSRDRHEVAEHRARRGRTAGARTVEHQPSGRH